VVANGPKPFSPYHFPPVTDEDWLAEARYNINWLYDKKAAWEILCRLAAKY
jgi:hypothetical protein